MGGRLYVLVQSGRRPATVKTIIRWAQALLPAAVLLSAPCALPADAEEDGAVVISVDADEVASGPLALADAIARRRSVPAQRGVPPGAH
jgi:hypothetical protein